MTTEVIDKLYLELSQFTQAKNSNDLKIEQIEAVMQNFKKRYDSPAAQQAALQNIWSVLNG